MNNEIFLKTEIKDEPMDDNSRLLSDYPDDTVETFKCDGSEISCGDSKIEIKDTKMGLDMSVKWKETGIAIFNSTNEINEGMPIKTEIKNEPVDDSSFIFLPEYVDDTLNASTNVDGDKIKCEDTKNDFDHTSGDIANFCSAELTEYFDKCEEEKKSSISVHSETHKKSTEEIYNRDVCNKGFNEKKVLYPLKPIHTVKKPYQCDNCDKSFYRVGHLTEHKRTHTGEKPYQCDVCKNSFSSINSLKIHKRTHTDEKPYQCDVCNKQYTVLHTLEKHKRTHTGEKPYPCDVCNKRFNQADHLNRHKRIHTGEKPYQCDVCKKCFSYSHQLKRHSHVHTGDKP